MAEREVGRVCPRCRGQLSEPASGDVHCYVECLGCGERFELDDPELVQTTLRVR